MTDDPTCEAARIARGGLFHEMQARLGLVTEDDLRPVFRAFLLVVIAWGVPLVISVFEGKAFGSFADMPFLLHLPVLSRFLLGVALLVAMEPVAEAQLATVLRPLLSPPLLAPDARAAVTSAAALAVRRRNSRATELIFLAVACAFSVGAAVGLSDFDPVSWAFTAGSGGQSFSYAALWCLWISSPIYFFLVTRWIWRILIVALLLRSIAGLDLRLSVTHPDGAGGIAFVGEFPNAYTLFVFALSCNLGAAIAEHFHAQTITTTIFTAVMIAWLLITNGLLSLPALFFTKPLSDLKQETLEAAQAQATRRQLAEEHGVMGKSMCDATEAEISEAASVPDPKLIFNAARNLSTVLIQRASLLPISAAAVLPVFAAGATQLPAKELFLTLRKLLLF